VNRQGGSTGQFLREEFGIDVDALAPQFKPSRQPSERQNIPEPIVVRQSQIGCFRRADFTGEAWEVLAYSSSIAKEEAGGLVGSPQLFMGMYQLRNGALRRALSRLGFDLRQGPNPGKSPAGGKQNGTSVEFTQNVLKMLKRAGEYAAADGRDKVSDEDIMSAFVEHGGGETGKYLRSSGFELKLLTSWIFRDDGELDLSRFDEEARRLLNMSLECAGSRGNKKLRIVHLVYAMLLAENNALAVMIRRQGKDPVKVAGLLTRSGQMTVEVPATRIRASASGMELGLIRALCAAEPQVRGQLIGVKQITREILSDQSGQVTRFLADHGIKMEG
jgi:ATP-dependent Clp protease ATP-binding subunit ClpA